MEADESSGHSSATVQLAFSKLLSGHSKWIRLRVNAQILAGLASYSAGLQRDPLAFKKLEAKKKTME